MLARMTGGLSPYAAMEAWASWAAHLAVAPGRQIELAERAQHNLWKLARFALSEAPRDAEGPFSPRPTDHRFADAGWQRHPFNLFAQGFLAVNDWWGAATAPVRGAERRDIDRVAFMARQMLDAVAPSNFAALNPEVVAATRATGGANLMNGVYKETGVGFYEGAGLYTFTWTQTFGLPKAP